MKKTLQTVIYVGLNDSKTHEQKFDTEKYISILKNVCRSYGVAFSLNTVSGGYIHDDGTYVEENTLVITLIGAEGKTVEDIATDLCVFFHQESVMVTSTPSEVFFIGDRTKDGI